MAKNGVFDSKQNEIMQIFDHSICFGKNANVFRRKLAKIAENCNHNIDPRFRFKNVQYFFVLTLFSDLPISYV
jgi:hypothetical protein